MRKEQISILKRAFQYLNAKKYKRYVQIKIEELKGDELYLSITMNDGTLKFLAKESFALTNPKDLIKKDKNQKEFFDEEHYLMTLIAFAATDIRIYLQESLHGKNISISLNDNSRLSDIFTLNGKNDRIMVKLVYDIDSLKIHNEPAELSRTDRIKP